MSAGRSGERIVIRPWGYLFACWIYLTALTSVTGAAALDFHSNGLWVAALSAVWCLVFFGALIRTAHLAVIVDAHELHIHNWIKDNSIPRTAILDVVLDPYWGRGWPAALERLCDQVDIYTTDLGIMQTPLLGLRRSNGGARKRANQVAHALALPQPHASRDIADGGPGPIRPRDP